MNNNFENDYGQLYIYIGNDDLFKKLCKEINYDTDTLKYLNDMVNYHSATRSTLTPTKGAFIRFENDYYESGWDDYDSYNKNFDERITFFNALQRDECNYYLKNYMKDIEDNGYINIEKYEYIKGYKYEYPELYDSLDYEDFRKLCLKCIENNYDEDTLECLNYATRLYNKEQKYNIDLMKDYVNALDNKDSTKDFVKNFVNDDKELEKDNFERDDFER